jgi:chromate transporter
MPPFTLPNEIFPSGPDNFTRFQTNRNNAQARKGSARAKGGTLRQTADLEFLLYNKAMEEPALPNTAAAQSTQTARVIELALLFLRLGATAFGGPAAHVALMREAVVARKKWLTEQQFLDLLGATNLIPGPNSTEMAIHVGYLRAGFPGLLVAGASFILPAMVIVMGIAWGYVTYGSTPQATWLLYGIKPVIIAIVLHALWNLGRQAIKGPWMAFIGVVVVGLYLSDIHELFLLFAAGLLVMVIRNRRRRPPSGLYCLPFFLPAVITGVAAQAPFSLVVLFLTFLKIGSVLYGGGYVLLAFVQADFVDRLGWLTQTQLIDAVAVGQVTPGPLFTTATFIGYLMGGVPGAVLATVGIFLPAFIFVAITNPYIPRLRSSPWAAALLDGINVASIGLMAGVTLQLGQASLVDLPTLALALAAAVLLLRFKVNATALVVGSGAVGLLLSLF